MAKPKTATQEMSGAVKMQLEYNATAAKLERLRKKVENEKHMELIRMANEIAPKVPKALKKLVPTVPLAPAAESLQELNRQIGRAARKYDEAVRLRISLENKITPRILKSTGEQIPCSFDDDEVMFIKQNKDIADIIERDAAAQINRLVRSHPMFKHWLCKLPTMANGEKTAARLLGNIDFEKCTKPSSACRFAGVGFDLVGDQFLSQRKRAGKRTYDEDTGELTAKEKGAKLSYMPEIKAALYNWAQTLLKSPEGTTTRDSRYYKRYIEKKLGLTSMRPDKPKWWIERTAQRCAARLLIEDMYIVGRTMLGLPVWPEYHAARSGYSHGGKVCVNEPRLLTWEQALALVGGADIGPASVEAAE